MIVNEIAQALDGGSSRLAVFIRHGEKQMLRAGPALITQQAKKSSSELGARLRDFKVSIKVYSSPELRCVQTAEVLSKEIFGVDSYISVTSFLGQPGIHVKNNMTYLDIFKEYGARVIYSQWKNGKYHDSLRTVDDLRSELSSFLGKTAMDSRISLFVSQSGTIAALGYALGLKNYDIENNEWVSFLDGFVLKF